MHTVGDLILKSTKYLEEKDIETPRLDAELLLANVLGCERLGLYMDWNKPLVELEVASYRELIRKRAQERVPVARLVNHRHFFGREYPVHSDAFVPRPETEGLIEIALELLETQSVYQGIKPVIFDIGTGSGCIIITMALEFSAGIFIATELIPETFEVAKSNAKHFHAEQRIDFRLGKNFADYQGSVHLLISNPPYIAHDEIKELPPEVSLHDPGAALDGGEDGLEIFDEILKEAEKFLVSGGWMIFEMGEDQEQPIKERFEKTEWISNHKMKRDLAGKPRYFMAQKKSSGK